MQKFITVCGLIITFFAFVLIVFMLPAQVYEVFQSADSKAIKTEIVSSEFGYRKVFGRTGCYLEIEIRILSNNENIMIRDEKPGDIATCGSKKEVADTYRSGDITTVYLAYDGKYYFSRGSYIEAVIPGLISIVWFVLLYIYIKKQTNKASKESR